MKTYKSNTCLRLLCNDHHKILSLMELSLEISSALRMLGDNSKVNKDVYLEVIGKSIQDLVSGEDKGDTSSLDDCDGGIVSSCHAALTTLLIECVKGNHSTPVLTSTLEDLNWPSDRITKVVENLDSHRQIIQSKLASIGTYPPHVVDVDWKLDYQVRSSTGTEGGGAMYLITLHTEESDGKRGKVTFSCSLSQLTHLVTRLRQASRSIQKYASNS